MKNIIFSSSATVYGDPEMIPITEDCPKHEATNPYGAVSYTHLIPFQDPEAWGIAVKKGDTELLDQLNEFIAQSKEDGEFDRLTEKYLAEEKKAFDEYDFKWFFDFE